MNEYDFLKEKFCIKDNDLNYYITGPIGPYPIPPKEPFSPPAGGSEGAHMYKQMYESSNAYKKEKEAYDIAMKIYETASKEWYAKENEEELNIFGNFSDIITNEKDRRRKCLIEKNERMARRLQNEQNAADREAQAQARTRATPQFFVSSPGYPPGPGYGQAQAYAQGPVYRQALPGYGQGYAPGPGYGQGYAPGPGYRQAPPVYGQAPPVYGQRVRVRKSRKSKSRKSKSRRSKSRKSNSI